MDMSQAVSGKYMKKEDVTTTGINLDIGLVESDNIGQNQDFKYILTWLDRSQKPLVLNATNIRKLMEMFGPESNDWRGNNVNVFNDMSVSFNGMQGGIRLRAPVKKDFDDDIGF